MPVGLDIGVDRKPHIEQHDLDERLDGGDKCLTIIAEPLPDLWEQSDQIFGIRTQIPLQGKSDALVGDPHAQAVVDVFPPVVAGGKALEIRRLGALQTFEGFNREEAAGFFETEEMGVKCVGNIRREILQRGVQRLEPGDILIGEFQKRLAPGDGCVVDAEHVDHGFDSFVKRFHAPRPRHNP